MAPFLKYTLPRKKINKFKHSKKNNTRKYGCPGITNLKQKFLTRKSGTVLDKCLNIIFRGCFAAASSSASACCWITSGVPKIGLTTCGIWDSAHLTDVRRRKGHDKDPHDDWVFGLLFRSTKSRNGKVMFALQLSKNSEIETRIFMALRIQCAPLKFERSVGQTRTRPDFKCWQPAFFNGLSLSFSKKKRDRRATVKNEERSLKNAGCEHLKSEFVQPSVRISRARIV